MLIWKLIGMLTNVIFVMLCMKKVTGEKIKIDFRIICVIWITGLMMLVINSIKGDIVVIRPVLALIIYSFMHSTLYRRHILNCIGTTFFLIFIFFLSEVLYSLILVLLNINFDFMMSTGIGIILSNFIVGIICYAFVHTKKFEEKISSIIKVLNRNKSLIMIVIIVLLMGILTGKNVLFSLGLDYIINLLLIIMFLVILCFLFFERKRKEKLASEQDILYNYIMKYEKELLEKSKIIHDFKNQLITIKGLVSDNKEKLREYLEELIKDLKNDDRSILKDLNNIPFGGLKGLLYFKLADLEKMGINLEIDIDKNFSKFEKLELALYKDIVKIIGVYLDNAIEAAIKTKEKIVEIEIFEQKNQLNFIVSNTYKDKILISKLGEAGYTSKGKNRGYGLAFVKDILEKNKNFKETKNITEKIYSVMLSVNL